MAAMGVRVTYDVALVGFDIPVIVYSLGGHCRSGLFCTPGLAHSCSSSSGGNSIGGIWESCEAKPASCLIYTTSVRQPEVNHVFDRPEFQQPLASMLLSSHTTTAYLLGKFCQALFRAPHMIFKPVVPTADELYSNMQQQND